MFVRVTKKQTEYYKKNGMPIVVPLHFWKKCFFEQLGMPTVVPLQENQAILAAACFYSAELKELEVKLCHFKKARSQRHS